MVHKNFILKPDVEVHPLSVRPARLHSETLSEKTKGSDLILHTEHQADAQHVSVRGTKEEAGDHWAQSMAP